MKSRMISSKRNVLWITGGLALTLVIGIAAFSRSRELSSSGSTKKDLLSKQQISLALADSAPFYRFPTEMDLEIGWNKTGSPREPGLGKENIHAVIEYSFDSQLQAEMEAQFQMYKPDFGAFVAMDASTGQVLSMVSYTTRPNARGNLALRSSFPSASVFKVVTAAAAIERERFNADTVISFNGANHTLYKSNVMKSRVTRWTRHMTLKAAFANSINTVFGKIGALNLEPAELRSYAGKFGFNRQIAADFPIEQGNAPIPEDPWRRAETAAGFTRENTMSPLQGALIAATIINDGVMMEPYFVSSVYTSEGTEVYTAKPVVSGQTVDPKTASAIRELMHETIMRGTSRKSFRGFFRKEFAELDVGGKTGSLTGTEPKGKYDWFVGFGSDGKRKIAIAALTIHEKLWKVKSSVLARKALETYFRAPKHGT